ncbi:heme-binding domain-containing protein [Aurantibacillus circumpalustris]|uniref:heme-binding domain-containing protein n=1 Tax=Aurantibacillus circumpalustris TaxID=3036359 RepID=UPI00295C2CB1|nr:heme-binding domain-containing protein [Aurantibacillus circumpalustris]
MKKKILLSIAALILIIQFIRIDKTNKPSPYEINILALTNPGQEISSILQNSCFDCHSNNITYPWYTNIAPVSWWIKHHINEGSQHLNFSEWGNYSSKKIDHKLKECVEMVEEGEMPMTSYTILHNSAKLTQEQRELLINWFKSLRSFESDKLKENS